MFCKNLKNNKGFTLIELVVVMAVFLFIIGAAIGIFISVIKNQKKILAQTQFLNQVSYIEEYMSKALRMAKVASADEVSCLGQEGFVYLLTRPDISGFYRGVKFINPSDNNVCQEFFLDTDGVLKEKKGGDSASAVPIIAANLQFDQINPIRFSINGSDGSVVDAQGKLQCFGLNECGAGNGDSVQPKVTIILNIKIAGDSQNPNRIIQTTVSARNLINAQ